MKKLLTLALIVTPLISVAQVPEKYISIDNKVLSQIQHHLKSDKILFSNNNASILKMDMDEIAELSGAIHHDLKRCGGFSGHSSFEGAKNSIKSSLTPPEFNFIEYEIKNQDTVKPLVSQLSEESIRKMILKLSSYDTRHYHSDSGVDSTNFIRDSWAALAAHRSDVSVQLVPHRGWKQPSIIMTIEGSENPEEIIVLGGHIDSIANTTKAPGADDNASGVSSITEVIKVLMQNNFKPKKTIQFMGYAAEEVGLLGSEEIAQTYKKQAKKVIGVMQLDMTLFNGTADKDIVMISDFTNKNQNKFLGKLIDEYVKVSWGYSQCGYGCSDHASWTAAGFPSSFPFEAQFEDHNPSIHTAYDTLESAGGDASHALKFSKLALSFLVEMAN